VVKPGARAHTKIILFGGKHDDLLGGFEYSARQRERRGLGVQAAKLHREKRRLPYLVIQPHEGEIGGQ